MTSKIYLILHGPEYFGDYLVGDGLSFSYCLLSEGHFYV